MSVKSEREMDLEKFGKDAWSYLTLLKRMYDEADKELAVKPEPSPMRVIIDGLVKTGDGLFYMKGQLKQ